MSYSVQPVILRNSGTGLQISGGTTGFPSSPFDNILFSEWVCLGTQPRVVAVANIVTFMEVGVNNSSIEVQLLAGVSSRVFDGVYAAPIGNLLSNILVSADPVTQRIQVYLNDAPLTLTSGGWTGSGHFLIDPPFNVWDIDGSGSTTPGSGIADLFVGAPGAFFDLSIVANRRKFITTNLTPVDLGPNASSVLGSAPPIYLTVRPGGVPDDFATNNGTGGSFAIGAPPLVFQTPGTCALPSPSALQFTDADLFFQPNSGFVDLSVIANRRLFIDANGCTQFLGTDGIVPFGSVPPVFLTRSRTQAPDVWASNGGNGGTFVITGGDLTQAPSTPCCSTRPAPPVTG